MSKTLTPSLHELFLIQLTSTRGVTLANAALDKAQIALIAKNFLYFICFSP